MFLSGRPPFLEAVTADELGRENSPGSRASKALGREVLKTAMEEPGLSARAHDHIHCVARTIADPERAPDIRASHGVEAISYHSLDRKPWTR
jgi:predicted ATPase with chaperone activity